MTLGIGFCFEMLLLKSSKTSNIFSETSDFILSISKNMVAHLPPSEFVAFTVFFLKADPCAAIRNIFLIHCRPYETELS
jgi:hypothetical protein